MAYEQALSPQPVSLPSQDCRHHGAETHYVKFHVKFLAHKTCEHNTIVPLSCYILG